MDAAAAEARAIAAMDDVARACTALEDSSGIVSGGAYAASARALSGAVTVSASAEREFVAAVAHATAVIRAEAAVRAAGVVRLACAARASVAAHVEESTEASSAIADRVHVDVALATALVALDDCDAAASASVFATAVAAGSAKKSNGGDVPPVIAASAAAESGLRSLATAVLAVSACERAAMRREVVARELRAKLKRRYSVGAPLASAHKAQSEPTHRRGSLAAGLCEELGVDETRTLLWQERVRRIKAVLDILDEHRSGHWNHARLTKALASARVLLKRAEGAPGASPEGTVLAAAAAVWKCEYLFVAVSRRVRAAAGRATRDLCALQRGSAPTTADAGTSTDDLGRVVDTSLGPHVYSGGAATSGAGSELRDVDDAAARDGAATRKLAARQEVGQRRATGARHDESTKEGARATPTLAVQRGRVVGAQTVGPLEARSRTSGIGPGAEASAVAAWVAGVLSAVLDDVAHHARRRAPERRDDRAPYGHGLSPHGAPSHMPSSPRGWLGAIAHDVDVSLQQLRNREGEIGRRVGQ